MNHSIPENAKNSDLVFLIDEYVRLERDRMILKQKWFQGLTFEELAEKYDLSTNATKNIVYGIGDKVLLKLK